VRKANGKKQHLHLKSRCIAFHDCRLADLSERESFERLYRLLRSGIFCLHADLSSARTDLPADQWNTLDPVGSGCGTHIGRIWVLNGSLF
jgi:hypothetical protein